MVCCGKPASGAPRWETGGRQQSQGLKIPQLNLEGGQNQSNPCKCQEGIWILVAVGEITAAFKTTCPTASTHQSASQDWWNRPHKAAHQGWGLLELLEIRKGLKSFWRMKPG